MTQAAKAQVEGGLIKTPIFFKTMLRAPCCQGISARFTVDARMAHDNEQTAAAALSFNGLTRRYFAENKRWRDIQGH